MRRIGRILRLIPLAFFCAMFAFAALQVQRDRARDNDRLPVPNRLGERQIELGFMAATFREMNDIWMGLSAAFFPGAMPQPVATQHENPQSLSALKTRTRLQAQQGSANMPPRLDF